MKVISSRSKLVFMAANISTHDQIAVHRKRMAPHSILHVETKAFNELEQQAVHYDANYHLMNNIRNVRKRRREYELLVSWIGFKERDDETREPLMHIMENMP